MGQNLAHAPVFGKPLHLKVEALTWYLAQVPGCGNAPLVWNLTFVEEPVSGYSFREVDPAQGRVSVRCVASIPGCGCQT